MGSSPQETRWGAWHMTKWQTEVVLHVVIDTNLTVVQKSNLTAVFEDGFSCVFICVSYVWTWLTESLTHIFVDCIFLCLLQGRTWCSSCWEMDLASSSVSCLINWYSFITERQENKLIKIYRCIMIFVYAKSNLKYSCSHRHTL